MFPTSGASYDGGAGPPERPADIFPTHERRPLCLLHPLDPLDPLHPLDPLDPQHPLSPLHPLSPGPPPPSRA